MTGHVTDGPAALADGVLDDLDLDVIAALQHAPRASFDTLARAVDASARTVIRRYRRLVGDGLLRVICEVDWSVFAESVPVNLWVRAAPGRMHEVAAALVERDDTTYVTFCSGRADVFCMLHPLTRRATADALVTDLPRLDAIAAVEHEWVLRRLRSTADWRIPRLDADAVQALVPQREHRAVDDRPPELGNVERTLIDLLRYDARLPLADLARALDVPESRARRLATHLFDSGLLRPRVEIEPALLGYPVEAVLSLRCPPAAIPGLLDRLGAHPSTRFLGLTAGTATVTCVAVFRGEWELADLLIGPLVAAEETATVECSLQLEVLKRYWTPRPVRSSGSRTG